MASNRTAGKPPKPDRLRQSQHVRSATSRQRLLTAAAAEFAAGGARVAQATADPADKIRGFVDAIAVEAEARPHFPPIWFREIAEGGAHLDATIVRDLTDVVQALESIVDEGARA